MYNSRCLNTFTGTFLAILAERAHCLEARVVSDWTAPFPEPDWVSPCGNAILYNRDCLEVLPLIPEGSVDAVVTDPPYGISLSNHARGKERRDRDWTVANDGDTSFGESALAWANDRRICTVAFASPSKPWSGDWRSRLVWHKHGLGMGGDRNVCWKSDWELVQVRHNGRLLGSRESSVLRGFDIRPDEFIHHPCEKPTDLLAYLIAKVRAQAILDPFTGSGTTGVAALRLGRKFIGCEIEKSYFDIAKHRIANEHERFSLFNASKEQQGELFSDSSE